MGMSKRSRITSSDSNTTVEDQGARKKVRGYTQQSETWNTDSTEKIAVRFCGKPVGYEGNELVKFIGTLVRTADHVSIAYPDWRKVPMQKKEDMYSLVKSKFIIHSAQTSLIKEWIFQNMGKQWKVWKGSLKARMYDPSLTIDEIVAKQTKNDDRLDPTQFKVLVTRWFTPEYQSTCAVNRLCYSKLKETRVTGSNSFARLAPEVTTKNNGVHLAREEMFITARTPKDSIVDDKAVDVVASLKSIESDSTSTSKDPDNLKNDDYSKVKSPEKKGDDLLGGRMPTAKINGDSLTESQTIRQLQSVVNVMLNIIQEHIPNANLSTVLNNMNIQVPGTGTGSTTCSNSIS